MWTPHTSGDFLCERVASRHKAGAELDGHSIDVDRHALPADLTASLEQLNRPKTHFMQEPRHGEPGGSSTNYCNAPSRAIFVGDHRGSGCLIFFVATG